MNEYVLLLSGIMTCILVIIYEASFTHRSLDHLHALVSHCCYHSWHIHYTLSLYLLQDGVNSYECSCATYTSTGDKQCDINHRKSNTLTYSGPP